MTALTAFCLYVAAAGPPAAATSSPWAGRGILYSEPFSQEEIDELEALHEMVRAFEEQAAEYREHTRKLIEHRYQEKRDIVHDSYEALIVKLEVEQRARRDGAIVKFEEFLRRYPDDPRYTPDAMFRLSELYFERSYDEYFQARQIYETALAAWQPDSGEAEPAEPGFHYEPTIAMMQRLLTEFPDYRLIDGAYYLLGYCLGEQGEEERAVDVYVELTDRFPNSRFAPEVWTRIGEYYFGANELLRALHAYTQVLGHIDSPFYDKAMYKLAWTHYRLADPERAPQEFQKAVDTFVELLDFNEKSKAEGKERGGELRQESIQYISICYADEQWGGLSKLITYLEGRAGSPYERDVLTALGDVYFDQTRFDEAVAAYRAVQERFPLHLDAPKIQEKIITAYERNRNFEAAAQAREVLSQSYSEGTPWHSEHQDNEEAVRLAADLTQKSLYSAAVFHHQQAQAHKEAGKVDLASESYRRAAEAYGKYLQRFPHDRQLYELTYYYAETLYYSLQFEPAAVEYAKVRDAGGDQFRETASFSVILSYENAVKSAEARGELNPTSVRKSSERRESEAVAAEELPDLKQKIVAASDRYAELLPDSDKTPKVLYKAAEIFYVYDQFEEARRRFNAILAAYPAHEVAEFSSNLIIESYLAEKNFDAVEKFSRVLLEAPGPTGRKEFQGELVKFKAGAMFKIAEDLAQKGEHEKAAELYLKLLAENPQNQFADSALNNAAVAYEQVKRYDSASKLYERLLADHPRSPLADNALFRIGLNAERFFDFEKAIAIYQRLDKEYPKSARRADALYNAALSLENTQNYERAAQEYARYCKLFPEREDAPEVCFRAGQVYEKMGDAKRVAASYEAYIQKYRKNATHSDHVIHAHLKAAQAYDKLKKPRDAAKHYDLAVKAHQRANAAKAAVYAAEAQFQLVEREFEQFKKITISGNGKAQQKLLKRKAEVLKKVEGQYMAILSFKQIDWTLASLFRVGQLYQNFTETILAAPCPPDVRKTARKIGASADEVCEEYRVILEERAATVEDKAVQAYEKTVEEARNLQVANVWTQRTLVALNKLRRASWPLQKEAKAFIDEVALSPPDLAGVEPAPAPPAPAGEEPALEPAPPPSVEPQPEAPTS
ncbi:MAG: tetratricopeptide repeat protein [Deltaproteobacteria bacterium]|nr:tetratricopeptide repeat protein [Deltaproteobacteria bacterium]